MKRCLMTCSAVMMLVSSGCAKVVPDQQPAATAPVESAAPAAPSPAPVPSPVPSPAPVIGPPEDGAAGAQHLAADQVLNRAAFVGGTLGDTAYHGGQVLLWQPEPNRYRLRASLNLGDGQWRSSNNTIELIFGPTAFTASVALLNDVERVERAVPLWAFHGHVENPEIALVEVQIPGVRWLTAEVKRGTWLVVYQGVLGTPGEAVEVIAYDGGRKEITRTTVKLQR